MSLIGFSWRKGKLTLGPVKDRIGLDLVQRACIGRRVFGWTANTLAVCRVKFELALLLGYRVLLGSFNATLLLKAPLARVLVSRRV